MESSDGTRRFYDDLADDYHLNYADWAASVRRQGGVLDGLIQRSHGDAGALRVLDCSCGIGTQAIGLALHGHSVRGTDLSPRSIERARHEAARCGVQIEFAVADMRHLATEVTGEADVVVSCDNSIPHLLHDTEIRQALDGMFARLVPGGLLVIGIRDYDALIQQRPQYTPPQLVDVDGSRSVLFQLWDWADDGSTYQLTMFILKQAGSEWETTTHVSTYRALLRSELERLAQEVGFADVIWHFPEETDHHQPLMTAARPTIDRVG